MKDFLREWLKVVEQCSLCELCNLCVNRTNSVWGRGNAIGTIMFVGEAPDENEDVQGMPFVGEAAVLFESILSAQEFDKNSYFITNILKCTAGGSKMPYDNEIEKCLYYLRAQVSLIKPSIIVCLGSTATRHIIGKDNKMNQSKGLWIQRKGYWMISTYHPSEILSDSNKKVQFWLDFKKVKEKYKELSGI